MFKMCDNYTHLITSFGYRLKAYSMGFYYFTMLCTHDMLCCAVLTADADVLISFYEETEPSYANQGKVRQSTSMSMSMSTA